MIDYFPKQLSGTHIGKKRNLFEPPVRKVSKAFDKANTTAQIGLVLEVGTVATVVWLFFAARFSFI